MKEEDFIEIEKEFLEQIQEGVSSIPKISKREIKYHANIAKLVSLLNASTAHTDSNGVTRIQHTIEDEDYRLELETYVMKIVRENLKIK